jgi:hypothetical protein
MGIMNIMGSMMVRLTISNCLSFTMTNYKSILYIESTSSEELVLYRPLGSVQTHTVVDSV